MFNFGNCYLNSKRIHCWCAINVKDEYEKLSIGESFGVMLVPSLADFQVLNCIQLRCIVTLSVNA